MDNYVEIALSLKDEASISHLKAKIYEEELKKINMEKPLKENKVDIQATYFVKKGSVLEVGFFIRNSIKSKVILDKVNLGIENESGEIIASENINLSSGGIIPPLSAIPFNTNFHLIDSNKFVDGDEYKIKFGELKSGKVQSIVKCDLEDLPIDMTFEEEKDLEVFIKTLGDVSPGEFTISFYKFRHNSNNNWECMLLVRNGIESCVNINSIPLILIDENNNIISRATIKANDSPIHINAMKSKLISATLNSDFLPIEKDISKCRIIFKED